MITFINGSDFPPYQKSPKPSSQPYDGTHHAKRHTKQNKFYDTIRAGFALVAIGIGCIFVVTK